MTVRQAGRKILIVEDEKDIAQPLGMLLEEEGLTAILAKDGADALDKIRGERFDLVLLDTKLPKVSGFEVCRKIRQNPLNKNVPIIVMSAFAQPDMRLPYGPLGVKHYFIKPFDFDVLRTTIAGLLT